MFPFDFHPIVFFVVVFVAVLVVAFSSFTQILVASTAHERVLVRLSEDPKLHRTGEFVVPASSETVRLLRRDLRGGVSTVSSASTHRLGFARAIVPMGGPAANSVTVVLNASRRARGTWSRKRLRRDDTTPRTIADEDEDGDYSSDAHTDGGPDGGLDGGLDGGPDGGLDGDLDGGPDGGWQRSKSRRKRGATSAVGSNDASNKGSANGGTGTTGGVGGVGGISGFICHDFVQPFECNLDAGARACDFCVDRRTSDIACVHVSRPLRYTLEDGYQRSILANAEPHLGWCLPREFERRLGRNCNPNTGRWLLSRSEDGRPHFVCRCRYPNLMTNSSTMKDDCSLAVGCYPGQLDADSRAGLIDPYTSGFCECPALYHSDFDSTVGPLCTPNAILDERRGSKGLGDVLEAAGLAGDYKALPLSYVSTKFLGLFDGGQTTTAVDSDPRLPDPCTIDLLSGRPYAKDEEGCFAVRKWIVSPEMDDRNKLLSRYDERRAREGSATGETSGKSNTINTSNTTSNTLVAVGSTDAAERMDPGRIVVYCDSRSPRYLPIQTSSDYLLNNHGRYPNACLRLADGLMYGRQTAAEPFNVSSLFLLSHFNGKYHPDLGVLLKQPTPEPRRGRRGDERLERLFNLIDEFAATDEKFRNKVLFASHPVKPYGSRPLPLRHDLDNYLRHGRSFVIYTNFPDMFEMTVKVGKHAQPVRRAICPQLLRLVYSMFRVAPIKANLVYGQYVNKFYRKIEAPSPSDRFKVWAVQTDKEYNAYYVGSSWTRETGLVPPADRAFYTEWRPIKPPELQTVQRSKILFEPDISPVDAVYPAPESYCENLRICNTPKIISGTTGHFNLLPSFWTTVYRDADRPLVPNAFHPGFDTTVLLAFFGGDQGVETNERPAEVLLVADQLALNYMGVQQYSRLFRHDRNPENDKKKARKEEQENEEKEAEHKMDDKRRFDPDATAKRTEQESAKDTRAIDRLLLGKQGQQILGDGRFMLGGPAVEAWRAYTGENSESSDSDSEASERNRDAEENTTDDGAEDAGRVPTKRARLG